MLRNPDRVIFLERKNKKLSRQMRAEDIEYLLGQLNGISKENIPFNEIILDKRNQDEE